jgi:hypothetical protein
MEMRKLGNSDLHITRVGYGAWAIGGSGWQFAWGSRDAAAAAPTKEGSGYLSPDVFTKIVFSSPIKSSTSR